MDYTMCGNCYEAVTTLCQLCGECRYCCECIAEAEATYKNLVRDMQLVAKVQAKGTKEIDRVQALHLWLSGPRDSIRSRLHGYSRLLHLVLPRL